MDQIRNTQIEITVTGMAMAAIIVIVLVFSVLFVVALSPEQPGLIAVYDEMIEKHPECVGQVVVETELHTYCSPAGGTCFQSEFYYLSCPAAGETIRFSPSR